MTSLSLIDIAKKAMRIYRSNFLLFLKMACIYLLIIMAPAILYYLLLQIALHTKALVTSASKTAYVGRLIFGKMLWSNNLFGRELIRYYDVVGIAETLLRFFCNAGFVHGCLLLIDGKQTSIKNFFVSVRMAFSYMVAIVGAALIFVIGLFGVIKFFNTNMYLLFMVIALAGLGLEILWFFSEFFVIDKGYSVVQSFASSTTLAHNRIFKILLLVFIIGLFYATIEFFFRAYGFKAYGAVFPFIFLMPVFVEVIIPIPFLLPLVLYRELVKE